MSYLIDLLFPRLCSSCSRSGQYLCPDCRSKIIFRSIRPGDRLSLFHYHGAIKQLITDLKFNFTADVIPELIDFISSNFVNKYPHLLRYWQDNSFVLVPVPLHPRRFNWRGFNQSELICQQLSIQLNLKYDPNLLIRIKNTPPQTTIKDKLNRKTNTQSSFALNSDLDFRLLNFIVFDDVYTTGSTITSAKSAFPKNSEIWVLTIAG